MKKSNYNEEKLQKMEEERANALEVAAQENEERKKIKKTTQIKIRLF